MKAVAASVMIVALSAGSALADSRKFDYVCEGSQTFMKSGLRSGDTRLRQHLRIDLTFGKWCDGACNKIRDVKSFSDSRIVLSDVNVSGSREHTEINRVSRTLKSTLGAGLGLDFVGLLTVETCRPASFTLLRTTP